MTVSKLICLKKFFVVYILTRDGANLPISDYILSLKCGVTQFEKNIVGALKRNSLLQLEMLGHDGSRYDIIKSKSTMQRLTGNN